ncbi:hypothetical protein [Demequina flava]|uniref:hypothetical protein n=1 Tax=Demequina flava TaxID=1095025 RepID=UPI000783DCAD|nr:hypothetical protein [Demequina flava]
MFDATPRAHDHVIGAKPNGMPTAVAELRQVVEVDAFGGGWHVIQAPFRPVLAWRAPRQLDLGVGDAVFGLWTDKLFAGTVPGTHAWCTDPTCEASVWRVHGAAPWRDSTLPGPHFEVLRSTAVPGVDLEVRAE